MSREIDVEYTNWRGAKRQRRIIPVSIRFGATKWHPQPQWLLSAIDTETNSVKDFALMDCDFTILPPGPDGVSHETPT